MNGMTQENLFSYVIAYNGDPRCKKDILSLGRDTCKPKIRKVASIGDWVIATLGRNFLKENFTPKFVQQHQNNYQHYLVYAMQVSRKEPLNTLKSKEKNILYSDNFYVFNNLLKMPREFHELIKKQQGHKRFPHKEKEVTDINLMNSFIRWLKKHPKEEPHLFELSRKPDVCKKSVACAKTRFKPPNNFLLK